MQNIFIFSRLEDAIERPIINATGSSTGTAVDIRSKHLRIKNLESSILWNFIIKTVIPIRDINRINEINLN